MKIDVGKLDVRLADKGARQECPVCERLHWTVGETPAAVEDGEIHRLLPDVDPAELTVQLATALEGGGSVTVGIEPPLGREKTGALVIGQNASSVLVTTDDR